MSQELFQSGHDVLAIDVDDSKVQDQLGNATSAVRADATHESVLKELDVADYDVCIVSWVARTSRPASWSPCC